MGGKENRRRCLEALTCPAKVHKCGWHINRKAAFGAADDISVIIRRRTVNALQMSITFAIVSGGFLCYKFAVTRVRFSLMVGEVAHVRGGVGDVCNPTLNNTTRPTVSFQQLNKIQQSPTQAIFRNGSSV
jgi:hypothetical protein